MTVLPMRHTAVALAALLTAFTSLLVSAAPRAEAAPPIREEVLYSAATDMQVRTPFGLAVVDAYLGTSRGVVALYDDDRTQERAVTGEDFTVTVTADAVTGSGPLYATGTGEPIGTAVIDLGIVRTSTEVLRYRRSIGNHAEMERHTVTKLALSGTVTLMGQSFAVEGSGEEILYTFFWNAPASEVGRDASGTLSAMVPGANGQTVLLSAERDHFAAVVFDAEGQVTTVAFAYEGTSILRPDGLHGVLYVDDLSGREPVERTVDVPGRLDHHKVRTVEQRPKGEVHLTTQVLTLHGVLDLGPGLAFDLEGVQGEWQQTRWVHRPAHS